MKSFLALCFVSLSMVIPAIITVCAADTDMITRDFISSMESYKNGDYQKAVDLLESIAARGVQNGKLYYNLGNAHLKNDNLGNAVLWYERALQKIPGDPDLRFNYEYALTLTKDARENTSFSPTRIFFFWKYHLSRKTVVWTAISLNLIVWLFIIVWRMTRRKGFWYAACITFLPALIFIATAFFNYYESTYLRLAIILPKQISVRSGLLDNSTELFKLHAGAKVRVVRTLRDHLQIRYSKDKIGWIAAKNAGII
ncbi:MAG: tetratricopeptide repeat protein [Desulfobacteraceae bacterium]|nr:tetratricopeptide repeat protein [Desulfobacteraceae bacterium]